MAELQIFEEKYNLQKQTPPWIISILARLEKILPSTPENIVEAGIGMNAKRAVIQAIDTIRYYISFKQFFTQFYTWFFRTPMRPELNKHINNLIIWHAINMGKFEKIMQGGSPEIDLKLAEASKSMTGIAGHPLAYVFAGVALVITYLFKKPEAAYWTLKRKVMDYDMETMRRIQDMSESGKTDSQITAYMALREKGIDRSALTFPQTNAWADNNFYGKGTALPGVTQTAATLGGMISNPMIVLGLAAAAIFLMKKK